MVLTPKSKLVSWREDFSPLWAEVGGCEEEDGNCVGAGPRCRSEEVSPWSETGRTEQQSQEDCFSQKGQRFPVGCEVVVEGKTGVFPGVGGGAGRDGLRSKKWLQK